MFTAPPPGDSSPGVIPCAPSVSVAGDVVLKRSADTGVVPAVRPPPEPPPQALDIMDGGHVSPLVVPQSRPQPTPMARPFPLVTYHIPLDKARRELTTPSYPQGSIMDPGIMVRPSSPTTPFEFPFDMPNAKTSMYLEDETCSTYTSMGSVMRVVGLPRVYGLRGDEGSFVKVMRSSVPPDCVDNPSLMDGGANICITGVLDLLIDVEPIPPLPILVATTSNTFSLDDCCTKKGLIPLTLADGSIYYQPCYYCKNATETIISPEAIVAASDTLVHWTQEGHRGDAPGSIRFTSASGLYSITLRLEKRDGLYYCPTDVFTVDNNPARPSISVIRHLAVPQAAPQPDSNAQRDCRYAPVTKGNLTESELWMLRLGSPGEQQLDLLPGNVTGVPQGFHYHPFRYIDWKEEARIQKQAAGRSAERTMECKRRFYMDFGFMRASTSQYTKPNKKDDRVVLSYDGFSSYLLVVDEASRFIWVFLEEEQY